MPKTSDRRPGYGGGGGGGNWTPQGVTTSTVGGITAGTNLGVVPTSIQGTLISMFYPYLGPTVSLTSTPAVGVYEFGNAQTPINLSATTVRNSNPITSVIFQRSINGGAFATIDTVAVPLPNGGLETFSDTPPAPVAVAQVASQVYRSTVGDGTTTANSNTRTYSYVYPFYYGSGAVGLSGAGVGALTKAIVVQGSYTRAFAPVAQVYYYAYPSSYPALTSIIDQNGFNITADWTVTTPVVITGLDATPQNYRVYEFNNLTSLAQNITFNF